MMSATMKRDDSSDHTPAAFSREMQRRSAGYKSGADPGVPWSELRARHDEVAPADQSEPVARIEERDEP